MNTSLFFNLGFDLAAVALVLFVVWFFINLRNAQSAFHWLTGAILALIVSLMLVGYGGLKQANDQSSVPSQNQSQINALKQEVSTLKHRQSSQRHHVVKPTRVVNKLDNVKLKQQVNHHAVKVSLTAKVLNLTNRKHSLLVRGVHSRQQYLVQTKQPVKNVAKGNFVIANGKATNMIGKKIRLNASSVTQQR